MWVFYHNVASNTASATVPIEAMVFAGVVMLTGLVVMLPSYFEKRNDG